jgi:twitching motility protein PilT
MFSESIVGIVSQTLVKKKDGKGRVCAQEILIATHAVRNLIREEKASQMVTVMQTGKSQGMQTMDQCLREAVARGDITLEAALQKAHNPQAFAKPQLVENENANGARKVA